MATGMLELDDEARGLARVIADRISSALASRPRRAEQSEPETPSDPTIVMTPFPRQREFLELHCEEALFGGAAGGGKSEMLLYWLAQGTHLPDYSGIIFRRTYPMLSKSNDSLIEKAKRMFGPLGATFHKTDKQFRFPSGAMIELGHLQYEDSVEDYQGGGYHRIAFDELTQFTERQYTYMFSRKRRLDGYPIDLGVRASSNPGGRGHQWVKSRFVTAEALKALAGLRARDPSPPGSIFWSSEQRAFVPARIADNLRLDIDDYIRSLQHLAPIDRERLMNGDWSINAEGLIKPEWLRYYRMAGEHVVLLKADGSVLASFDQREASWFTTEDTAGTSKDKAKESRGKPPSWSVAATWCKSPSKIGPFLVLRDLWRERVGFADLCDAFRAVHKRHRCRQFVENKHFGPAVADLLAKEGIPIEVISAYVSGMSGDTAKVERSAALQNKLKRGEVFLPLDNNAWCPELESEWLGWTGQEDEVNDQIDVASYAAIVEQNIGLGWGGVVNPGQSSGPRRTHSQVSW